MEWARLVAARFGFAITNFTSSFSDGKAFCYLISFYCPETLPMNQIRSTQVDLASIAHRSDEERRQDSVVLDKAVDGNWVGVFSPPTGISVALKRAMEGEKFNFLLVREAVRKLGQTPYLGTNYTSITLACSAILTSNFQFDRLICPIPSQTIK